MYVVVTVLILTQPVNPPDLDSIDPAYGGMTEVAGSAELELEIDFSPLIYVRNAVFPWFYGTSRQLSDLPFGVSMLFIIPVLSPMKTHVLLMHRSHSISMQP